MNDTKHEIRIVFCKIRIIAMFKILEATKYLKFFLYLAMLL